MMLTDAGPLIAIVNERDPHNGSCVAFLRQLTPPMVTILPAFTEAMHFAARADRWPGQDRLWKMVERGALVIRDLEPADLSNARDLMEQYRDIPMDFADAALVAYAERENLDQIFTLDRRGFTVFRLRGRRAFTIYP